MCNCVLNMDCWFPYEAVTSPIYHKQSKCTDLSLEFIVLSPKYGNSNAMRIKCLVFISQFSSTSEYISSTLKRQVGIGVFIETWDSLSVSFTIKWQVLKFSLKDESESVRLSLSFTTKWQVLKFSLKHESVYL